MSKTRIFAKSDPIFKMIFGDPENKTAFTGKSLLQNFCETTKFS